MTNHEPKHPPADMAGLDDLIWRIKERMPIDHTEMLALAARVKVLEAENERLREIVKEQDQDLFRYRVKHMVGTSAALKGVDTV